MPLTKAKTDILDLNKDLLINGLITVGKGSGSGNELNLACGGLPLGFNTTGSQNTAVGAALYSNTTGSDNVGVGVSALENNTTGGQNVAVGVNALLINTIGIQNTACGCLALSGQDFYNNSGGFGYNALVSGSNQIQLGNSLTTTYVYGTVQSRSDIRDKTDIRDTELGLDFVKSLRPVDFRWDVREDYRPEPPTAPSKDANEEEKAAYEAAKAKWIEDAKLSNITHDGSKKRNRFHHGLIAQEVKSALEAKGIDFGGFQDHKINGGDDVLSIGYDELIAPMIKAIQELSAEVASLKAQLNP